MLTVAELINWDTLTYRNVPSLATTSKSGWRSRSAIAVIDHREPYLPQRCNAMVTSTAGPHCSCKSDFTEWYRDFEPAIRRYVFARTHDLEYAADCTNQTFLHAFAQRSSFRCSGHGVRPWLFAIARNIVRDYHRSRRKRQEAVIDRVPDSDSTVIEPSPEEQFLHQELILAINELIDNLPNNQANCIRLRYLNEKSVAETARMMNRAEGAIRALQYRALRSLREMVVATRLEVKGPI